jgi:hypothetical protein
MKAQPIRFDDDKASTPSRQDVVPRRGQEDRPDPHWRETTSMALLVVRAPGDLDGSLRAVTALLAARRLAGVCDVVVGAFIGRRGHAANLEPWTMDEVVGTGHLVRASCVFGGRWSLTWFDAALGVDTRARRRQLLAALERGRQMRLPHATFMPVIGPDEHGDAGAAAVMADLVTRRPELPLGQGVLVHDPTFGVIRRG